MPEYMEENLEMPLRDVLVLMQNRIMKESKNFGVPALMSPTDSWVYQEIIHETKPDVIIEIGNSRGGGLLYYAHLCDLLGSGRVIGIDISHNRVPDTVRNHQRVTLIEGDACDRFPDVYKLIPEQDRVLVIEDSSHTYENTLNILRLYSTFVKPGDYFIVEDGICHHGLSLGPKPGPYEATGAFLAENSDFKLERSRESFLITWNPKGYLRRISDSQEKSAKLRNLHQRSGSGRSRLLSRLGRIVWFLTPPILYRIFQVIFRTMRSRRSV